MNRNPEPVDVEVGKRICALRLARGFNQSDLGRALGKTFQQVQKYEKGTNRVSCSVLYKIAQFLGVEPAYFFPSADGAIPVENPAISLAVAPHGNELARLFVRLDAPRRLAVLQCAKSLAGIQLAEAA